MRSSGRVAIVGSVNEDTVVQADGSSTSDLGGVLFTAGALARLSAGSELEPWLLARTGGNQRSLIEARHHQWPDLQLGDLQDDSGPGYRCEIRYAADGSKTELLLGSLRPLQISEIASCLRRCGAVVVNFITGYELDLATLHAIRRIVRGPVFIDLHSLSLARDGQGRRSIRRLKQWPSWVACADVLQMNEAEANSLGGIPGTRGCLQFARRLLSHGPRVVVVTRAAGGAVCAWRDDRQGVHETQQGACEPESAVVDTTGCGDVFLAGLAAALLKGSDVQAALRCAALAAGVKCTEAGLAGLNSLGPELSFKEV